MGSLVIQGTEASQTLQLYMMLGRTSWRNAWDVGDLVQL